MSETGSRNRVVDKQKRGLDSKGRSSNEQEDESDEEEDEVVMVVRGS